MKRSLLRLVAAASLLAVTAALPWRSAAAPAPTPGPAVLARGQDLLITQEHLDDAFINLRATLAAQGRTVAENQRPVIERQLLDKLVLTQLLLARATPADRETGTNKATKIIEEQKTRARSEARFEAQIRAAGMSPEKFSQQLIERAICEEVLDRELRPILGVTEEKMRAFYETNSAEFRQPERIRLEQIVLTMRHSNGASLTEGEKAEKKQLADRLLERARKGETISALAREYSDDPAGRDRGGEYIFPVDRMVPELEVAVLALATNQVSDVITTPYAFHIVRLVERMPGDTVPFNTVSNAIRGRLELEATQGALPAFQKRLFEEAKVEFLLPKTP